MHLWIVTIGSSDVQLISNKVNQARGKTDQQSSDKVWHYWYTDDLKAQHDDISFKPKPLFEGKEEPYRIAPRILGAVYNASSKAVQQEIWDYLTFPLLDNFVSELKRNQTLPDAIAILLTNQSNIFQSSRQRKLKSPYWQDTCELQSILASYFKGQDRFPKAAQIWVELEPNSDTTEAKGLDDWNSVLNLVGDKLRALEIAGKKINLEAIKTIYVSHQAGTPAISSAVQFCSLAQFGDRVQFLVSNEQDETLTDTVESSAYLQGIKKEQAKKLLSHHDYSGVKDLLSEYLDLEARKLLEAAIQWNFAKFTEFKDKLKDYPQFTSVVEERTKHENWSWKAYESAYLGVVRLEQDNIVESFFHSFRSIEGLIKEWALNKYKKQIKYSNRSQPNTPYFHDENLLDQRIMEWFNCNKNNRFKNVGLFGKPLFGLLKASYSSKEWQQHSYLKILDQDTLEERNSTFHSLRGLQRSDLFAIWDAEDVGDWKNNIRDCLNFISGQSFESLEEASLMVRVHEELVTAIAAL